MKTKNLYVVIKNCGDGSSTACYTFNEKWVTDMEIRDGDYRLQEWEMEEWCDGDGFHYDILTVPEECTLESLGIHYDCAEKN